MHGAQVCWTCSCLVKFILVDECVFTNKIDQSFLAKLIAEYHEESLSKLVVLLHALHKRPRLLPTY